LGRINLPATVTKKRSHVAGGFLDDLIKNMEQEIFLGLSLFLKFVTDTENDTFYKYEQIVIKRTVKCLNAVIILNLKISLKEGYVA
jgi:hypothetical protein